MGVDQFDTVISDNLVEPLLYASNVILSGSFLWHDILQKAYPQHAVIQDYASKMQSLLLEKCPPMIVNRYMVMPAVTEQTQTHGIGFISFYEGQPRRDRPTRERHVLVALGNSPAVAQHIPAIREMLLQYDNDAVSMTVYVPERFVPDFQGIPQAVTVYDFRRNPLHQIDLAIIRAGIGTLSDCIAARVPMLCVEEPDNPEISYNIARLQALGIGFAVSPSALTLHENYGSIVQNFEALSLAGADEAAQYLLQCGMV